MILQIRKTSKEDINFYKLCLENDEFRWNLYGNDNVVNWDKFLSEEDKHLKFVISKVENEITEDVAFAHFYYNQETYDYESIGGIKPQYFNTGMGLYASIALSSYLFNENPNMIINTAVFKYNQRALKVWKAIGFIVIDENEQKILLRNNLSQFNNKYVELMLKRIKVMKCYVANTFSQHT